MKKIFVMMVSLTAVLSCTKNISIETPHNENSPELVHMTFTVSCEDTKTTLNSDRSVSFASGDKIAIFSNGTRYEFSAESAGHEVAFTGDIEPSGTYYAVYPYSATSNTSTVSEGTITGISVSSGSQGTGIGKFNSKQAVMVAVTNTDHLTFKHVMAFLRVTVPEGITDLKEIVVFNRDNDSSNTAGAITGTFNVTPSADDAPSIEVTTANFQAGLVGPSGSSNPMPAGDYYIPVLPAQLTAKKGIDLKLTFMDSFIGRAFNGNGIKLNRCQVYYLGTVTKTTEYIYNNFEQQVITGFSGNTNALSVVANPFKTASNSSDYVLKDDMSGSTSSTSGYIQIETGTDYGYTKFPSNVRSNYDKIRIKIYLGSNAYYPRLKRGSNTAARPYKINDVLLNGDQGIWEANVKTDDWNVLEYRASDIDGGWTNFTNLLAFQIRAFVNWGDGNTGRDDTHSRIVYVDDITFVLK
ncbi:MAG: hypothetical protein J5764_00705 [Bacteroidales bacterium]|nr:hypothetical protein [Bacteroidales bacterium]